MLQFLLPIGIVTIKVAVKELTQYKVNDKISEGTTRAVYEVEKKALKFQKDIYTTIIINIVALFFAIYVLGIFIDNQNVITYVVSSIYLSSVVYTFYTVIKSWRDIYNFIIIHKCILQKYIYVEIFNEARSEAKNEVNNLNPVYKSFNHLFGKNPSKIAKEITDISSKIASKNIFWILINLIIVLAIYIVVFRFMVAPTMIEDCTHLSVLQSAVYPIFFSIDYFLGTTLLSMIV